MRCCELSDEKYTNYKRLFKHCGLFDVRAIHRKIRYYIHGAIFSFASTLLPLMLNDFSLIAVMRI